jgi:hypothetical protein
MKYGTIPLSIYTHKGETHNSLRKERRKEKKENFKTTKWTRQFIFFALTRTKIHLLRAKGWEHGFYTKSRGLVVPCTCVCKTWSGWSRRWGGPPPRSWPGPQTCATEAASTHMYFLRGCSPTFPICLVPLHIPPPPPELSIFLSHKLDNRLRI